MNTVQIIWLTSVNKLDNFFNTQYNCYSVNQFKQ